MLYIWGTCPLIYFSSRHIPLILFIRNLIQDKLGERKTSNSDKETSSESFINSITKINFQGWCTKVRIIVEDFELEMTTLVAHEQT